MAEFNVLKDAIAETIYSNDNQEISGDILQNVLITMLDTIQVEGRIFTGIASPNTNPGTPDSNVFFLASTEGIYPNFSNISVEKGEISVLYNDANNNWAKSVLISNFEVRHENAYTDDFLYVEDFALDEAIKDLPEGEIRQNAVRNALNTWLDAVAFSSSEDEIKKLGRCRLFCDGVNLECYNYIVGFASNTGIQTVSGPCNLTTDNRVNHSSVLTFNQVYRTKQNGVWGNWEIASDFIFLTESELDNLSSDIMEQIFKHRISKAIITSSSSLKNMTGIAYFLCDDLSHVLNIRYETHTLLKYDSGIIYPVIQQASGDLTQSHDDKYVYAYQKTYNNGAVHTGGDVPETSHTWSKWKLVGGTAYNNEVIKFLLDTISHSSEQDNKIKNLEAKTLHENAYTDDFLYVEDFALDDAIKDLPEGEIRQNAVRNALNTWLNAVAFSNSEDEIKKLGRCRLFCDGVNLECYNYIVDFASNTGIQTVSGPCDLTTDNRVNHSSVLTFNQVYRTKQNGVWGNWEKK